MPPKNDALGTEYFDSWTELLEEFKSWGSEAVILKIEIDSSPYVHLRNYRDNMQTVSATPMTFERTLKFLTQCSDGKGWYLT